MNCTILTSISDLLTIENIGQIVGGLGIFLLGITMLGEGLKKLAGNKLKSIIDKYTSTPFKGLLVGIFVTVLIQSSSGTTALAIGLIRAGLMSFPQAVGIILGANIGTTVTAFLIGLKIANYAPFFLVAGAFLTLFAKKHTTKHVGETLFGFGALFFGLTLMEVVLKGIAATSEFSSIVYALSNSPILGVTVGMIGTALIQSSSAFIGVIQGIYSSIVAENPAAAPLIAVLPILFGSNIGTTITAIFAATGGSKDAKRAAAVHVIFNTAGTVLFMLILIPFTHFITFLTQIMGLEPKMQIAVSHIIFNIITTVVIFPFVKPLVKFVKVIFPSKKGEPIMPEIDLSELDKTVVGISPTTALDIARRQTFTMGNLAVQIVSVVHQYVEGGNYNQNELGRSLENAINVMDSKLTNFLVSIEHSQMDDRDVNDYTNIMRSIKDIERIGDHCENLIEYFEDVYSRKEELSPEGKLQIIELLILGEEMVKIAINAFHEKSIFASNVVIEKENLMDSLEKKARNSHVERVLNGECDGRTYVSMVFIEILSNIERIGDHSNNIAENTKNSITKNPNLVKKRI